MKRLKMSDKTVGAGLVPARVASSPGGQGQALPLRLSSTSEVFSDALIKFASCLLVLCLVALCPAQALAQKKKVKEKRFEPVARQNLRDYEGRYVGIEESYWIEVRVGDDGRLMMMSREDERTATLEDIKLDGANLTATKVYTNGKRAAFVATFVDRVLNGERAFGLIAENMQIELPGITLTRIFYRRVRE
jgi:hypothetical protein